MMASVHCNSYLMNKLQSCSVSPREASMNHCLRMLLYRTLHSRHIGTETIVPQTVYQV